MTTIRPAKPEDLEALGQIAYATGFFGASAARYFPSQALFRDLWIRPYLDGVGACNFVAEDKTQILGYIVGTPDLRAYQRYFIGAAVRILRDAWFGRYPGFFPSARHLLRTARYSSYLAPLDEYPAQLHINLLETARGQGLGGKLMQIHLNCLRARGVPGVQLSTTRENVAAIRLYEKSGFRIYREWSSPLWKPFLQRAVIHVVMVKNLEG